MTRKKDKNEKIVIVVLALLLAGSVLALGIKMRFIYEEKEEMKLVLYEGPKTLEDASEEDIAYASEARKDITLKHCVDTSVKVDGQDCYVYDTNVNLSRAWSSDYLPSLTRTPITYFDFEGRADIEIAVPEQDLDKVTVSPMVYGIEPKINKEKHTVSFSITEPDTYTVMFNDTPERAIHIFANPLETSLPDFEDENVVYVGPGEWDIDTINIESGQTLYIAGGAVVHGVVNAGFAENITVMGRGIIDGSKIAGWQGKSAYIPLKFDNCKNVNVEGVIVLNSNAWVCQGYETENMQIDGVKIISARPNGDGITLQSCRNVEVKNSFVRSWDDSLVVKNYNGNSNNIHFSNMQLWTDLAQSMEIGYETNKGKKENASITDVSFVDICVLHNYHKPVISVHNADDAVVSDILFQNIVVEDAKMGSGDGDEMPYLIDINIAQNANWSSTKGRGSIRNITIDEVKVLAGKFCASRISGYDEEHRVSGVSVKNLEILGEKIGSFEDGKFEIDEATTDTLQIE